MDALHWLILIPYYFFSALGSFLALLVLVRLLRASPDINALVFTAIIAAAIGVLAPLLSDRISIDSYRLPGMLLLLGGSFLFAYLDALLQPVLPLALDQVMEEL